MGNKTFYTLKELSEILDGELLNDDANLEIVSIVDNSKHSINNSIFTAYKGRVSDSHAFIDEAFKNGSVAAVVTDKKRLKNKPGILVKNGYAAISKLSALFAGKPSKEIRTIGVTGTNGKTTTHWIIYHILNLLDFPSIRIGGLGIFAENGIDISGKVKTKNSGEIMMTTPSAVEIHKALKSALSNEIKYCVLETSSHAIDQYRVADVEYDVAVFTNLSPDHLNYHSNMEEYFLTKVKLFKQLANNIERQKKEGLDLKGGAVINIDDSYGKRLVKIANKLNLPIFTFGFDENADIRITNFKQELGNSVLTLEYKNKKYDLKTYYIGDYNASNIAAAFSVCVALELPLTRVADLIKHIPPVPGRLEFIGNEDLGVIVDYAHTGIGLEKVLTAVKTFAKNDLWVVFGCGGGKDFQKRPAMGKAAMEFADKIVLTNDNPKNENPKTIIDDILSSGCKPEFIELDRHKAIERSIKSAKRGDVIVLAGKGHEDYQIIGNKTIKFSDKEEALKFLNTK